MSVSVGQCGSVWVSVDQCGFSVDQCGSVWVSVGHCGSVWVGVYGLIWLGVGQCGSVWVGVYGLIWLGVGSSDADSLESVQLRTRVRSVKAQIQSV